MSLFHTTKLGTRTHYVRCGNKAGPLVLLLHGLGGSTATFTSLLPYLPQDSHSIVSIDFEGFGKTALASPDTVISIKRHVTNLDDLISTLQGSEQDSAVLKQPVVIIGHSLGSIIALHYAAQHPANVAGLGLLGVGRSAAHIPAACQRMRDLAKKTRTEGIDAVAQLATITNFPPGDDVPANLRQEVRKAVAASDPEGYAKTCEATVSSDHVDPDYSNIKCPAVFVCGEGDQLSPPERAQELSTLLKGPTVISIVRGGHQPILSDLDGTSKAVSKLFELVQKS